MHWKYYIGLLQSVPPPETDLRKKEKKKSGQLKHAFHNGAVYLYKVRHNLCAKGYAFAKQILQWCFTDTSIHTCCLTRLPPPNALRLGLTTHCVSFLCAKYPCWDTADAVTKVLSIENLEVSKILSFQPGIGAKKEHA